MPRKKTKRNGAKSKTCRSLFPKHKKEWCKACIAKRSADRYTHTVVCVNTQTHAVVKRVHTNTCSCVRRRSISTESGPCSPAAAACSTCTPVPPKKRARQSVQRDKSFCSREQLDQLDEQLDNQLDLQYEYHLPLHMGGTRRSLRNRDKVIEYEKDMDDLCNVFSGDVFLDDVLEEWNEGCAASEVADEEVEAETTLDHQCHQMRTVVAGLTPKSDVEFIDCKPTKLWGMVQIVFQMLGSPAEFDEHDQSRWEGNSGVINTIRDYLFLGRGWRRRRTIRRVLEYVRSEIDSGVDVKDIDVVNMRKKSTGRPRKLNDTLDRVVAKSLSKGFGMQLTASVVNKKADLMGTEKVHISSVYRSARKVFGGSCHNRPLKKTGSKDVDSVWCIARLAFALQLAQQFREDTAGDSMVGKTVVRIFDDAEGNSKPFVGDIVSYDADEGYYRVKYPDGDQEELTFDELRHPHWPKIHRLSVLWCDEKHKKVIIGPNNRHEWLFHVDPNNPDVYMSPKDGGVPQQPRAGTRAKYMQECRGLFGVMAKQIPGEVNCEGVRMQPFNYTGKKVIGPVAFEKRVQAEIQRVKNLKTTGTSRSVYWKDAGEGLPGGPYEARYGPRWREEVVERVGKGSNAVCNVTDLMDHVIEQGNMLFADTPFHDCWMVYHDALSAWWSVGAQDYIESKNFKHRQISSLDFTNVGTRYEHSLPGDTPEYMPLDSNLFSDLEKMVRWNVAATNELPRGHPDKFDLTTPASCWSAVCRTWEHAPTSERIVEDINRVFNAIDEVIVNKGRAIDFNKLRHGRRLREHIRSTRRSKVHSEKKTVDSIEGLHPVSRRIIIDLCND